MKPILPLVFLAFTVACKEGKKENTEPKPTTDSPAVQQPIDTPTATLSAAGKIDIETFGDIKIGQPVTETINALGEPDTKSKPEEWGADGLMHERWIWKNKGLDVNMSSEKNNPASKTIFSINATAPCTFKTRAGMGIGSTYDEIQAAYSRDISKADSNTEQVVVGSVYGGIIFTLTKGKVSDIFLGAAAE